MVIAGREERPFVGREGELAVLRGRWAQTPAGEGGVVVLAGEAGMGKTRLAARFAAEAHAGGATVLHGRIDEETVVPYQPFVEALRHYAAHAGELGGDLEALAPLVPELGGTAAEPGERENRRYRLFEAVAALLGGAARERPLLLVVEDLQWAGQPTLLLLRHVVRRLHGAPLLVLVTVRDAEAEPGGAPARMLADLSREHVVERVALGGLAEAETAALVGDAALARRLQDRTAGNPFFIEEMLRSLAEAPEDAPGVPEGVKDLVSRRLARLEPGTVETLTAAAVLGRDFGLATLAGMLGRPEEELLGALEEALRAGVVLEDAEQVDRFAFAHALVRETLYDAPAHCAPRPSAPARRPALEAAGAPPGGARPPLLRGARGGRGRGRDRAQRRGRPPRRRRARLRGGRMAPRAGAAGGRRATRSCCSRSATCAGRRASPARAPRSRRPPSSPAATAPPSVLARAALGAGGRFYMPTAADPAYVERLEEALAALGGAGGPLRARLLARLAEHLALADAGDRSARLGAEAVAMARAAGDDGALAAALMGHHAALLGIEHLDERLQLIDEAVALAERLEAHEVAALALHWRIYDLVELGDLAAAKRSHARLEALARQLHQPLYTHSALAWRGEWAHIAGRLDEAERIHRESLRIAEAAGAREARGFFLTQLFAVRRDQGRLGELAGAVGRLAAQPGSVGVVWRAPLPVVLLQAGERERAREAYDVAFAAALRGLPSSLFRLTGLVCVAEACAALGDAEGADALIEQLEPHAGRFVQTAFSGCWGSVRRFLGLLHATAGRPEAARAELEAALALHRALEAPILVAVTERDLADVSGARLGAL